MKQWLDRMAGTTLMAIVWDQVQAAEDFADAGPIRYMSVGWVMSLKDDYMVLCSTFGKGGENGLLTAIPYRCMVTAQHLKGTDSSKMSRQMTGGIEIDYLSSGGTHNLKGPADTEGDDE